MQFTVLASGSAGNATLIQADGFGVLIDAGLGPRQLAARLAAVGASWRQVHAVLLTHTHSDHWKDRTFAHLRRLNIRVCCHAGHHAALRSFSTAFADLHAARLVADYVADEELRLAPGLVCRPFAVHHDGGATFGFRLEGAVPAGRPPAVGYAADLGTWTPELACRLADVDLLALEFNHDVAMEMRSGRAPHLIARVLGDRGHLSNDQAAALLREVVRLSPAGRLRHVVQLHLSRDCNDPDLAARTARAALDGCGSVEVHTACQDRPGPGIVVGIAGATQWPEAPRPPRTRLRRVEVQPWLPGLGP